MKKGFSMFTTPEGWNIKRCFELAKKNGFQGVELVMLEKEAEISLDVSDKKLKEIKKMADGFGLEITSLASPLFWGCTFTDNRPKVRKEAMAITEKMLQAASILGADTILVVPGVIESDVYYSDAYSRAKECFQRLGVVAKKIGISIGLENGGMKFLATPLEFSRFLEEVDNEAVGIYLDTGNAMIEGYPEHWIRILGPKIKKIHLKDFRLSARMFPEAYTYLFHGDVRWPQVMAELRKVGYDDYLIAEFPRPRHFVEETFSNISKDIDRLISMRGNKIGYPGCACSFGR